jgi:hypothetical protein
MSPAEKNVTVGEVAPVTVTKGAAWRLVIGRFVVDWIETFAALIVGVSLFMPSSAEDIQKLGILLATPALSALVSAGRRSWPAIRAWMLGEDAK